jgi:hypothetical protein
MRRDLLIVFLATESAWTTQYRGEAPTALWTRIKKIMKQVNGYARYLAIVQSSGTGKSRMIEELGKTHLVIPVNLRGFGETGLSLFFCHTAGWQWFKISQAILPQTRQHAHIFPGQPAKRRPVSML